jgi:serine/threonine protein phosphatase PrpC
MHIEISGKSDIGKKRAANEDAFLIDADQSMLIVADGVGGLQAGQIASQLAVREIHAHLRGQMFTTENLSAAIQRANIAIYQAGLADANQTGMATTVNTVVFSSGQVHIAHVGDSRTYRFRQGALEVMTQDHNVKTFLAKGWITPEQIDDRISKEALMRALGMESTCIVDLSTSALVAKDLWLTATDGLFGLVSRERMEELLIQYRSNLTDAVEALIEEANANGGRDNITVVLADVHRV